MAEKDAGFQRLNAAVEQGDKLYPDTATAGREKIRQQLRTAKEVWDSLLGKRWWVYSVWTVYLVRGGEFIVSGQSTW